MIETGPCMNTYVLTGTYQTHMLSVNRPQHYFFAKKPPDSLRLLKQLLIFKGSSAAYCV